MQIENCANCGGTHFGSHACPFKAGPCVICGARTIMACSDCAIDSAGKKSTYVCTKSDCRNKHEAATHSKLSN